MLPTSTGQIFLQILLVILITTLSCSKQNDTDTIENSNEGPKAALTATPTPINPKAILDQSGKVMNDLQSFRFGLEHLTGGTPLAQGLILISTEGFVVKPDKLSLNFVGSAGNFVIRGNVITIGDKTFISNPLNDEWQVLQGQVSPLAYFDPALGISSMMSRVTNVAVLKLHNSEVHIGGKLPASALAPLFGPTTDESIDVELTIDLQKSYLTEVILKGRITATELDGMERTIELSNFNEPKVIEPPL